MIVYDFENDAYIRRHVDCCIDDTQTYYSKDAVKDILVRYRAKLARSIIHSDSEDFIPEMPTDWSEDDEIDGL